MAAPSDSSVHCVCTSGTYGFLQERIMAAPYGTGVTAEYFKFTVFLVFLNRVVSATSPRLAQRL